MKTETINTIYKYIARALAVYVIFQFLKGFFVTLFNFLIS